MKKNFIQMILVSIFVLFSFFYTNKAVEFVKNMDPLKKEIESKKSKYEIKSVDALINNDEIIPGYSGLSIDVNKSYIQMKKMNKYNSNYLIYEESLPTISLDGKYDKYIVKGNYLKESVALIFKINKDSQIVKQIYNSLEDKNVLGNFFIDGIYIENNKDIIYMLADNYHEVEILNYNNSYNNEKLLLTKNTLKNIINYEGNYCLLDNKNQEILDICSNNKMYTVIPSFKLNSFGDLKNQLESGVMIEVNSNKISELSTIINYIKQKGYNIVTLSELLSENRTIEK